MKRDVPPQCMLAIYDRPRDFPNQIVVRCWTFAEDGKLVPDSGATTFDCVELTHRGAVSAARGYCNRLGLSFVPRSPGDDPVLIETWCGRVRFSEAAQ